MRRSSTTVSGPATVLPRRYGEKLLQNSSDSTRPSAPAIMRMIPTVLMLNPEALTFTAKVKTAPTTSRKMLTPRLKIPRLLDHASTGRSPTSVWPGLSSKTLGPELPLRCWSILSKTFPTQLRFHEGGVIAVSRTVTLIATDPPPIRTADAMAGGMVS
jgi:hypothetical protein